MHFIYKTICKYKELLRLYLNNQNKKIPIDETEAMQMFKLEPWLYFNNHSGMNNKYYNWPSISEKPIYLEAIYIRIEEYPIGYIENISIDILNKQVIVGHFAIEKCLASRNGLGRVLANTLRLKLISKYGTKKIIFRESHSKFHQLAYSDFFKSIGATHNPTNNHPTTEWHWSI